MAQHIGPNIVTDGLVLSLDKYDEISYPGEPTTNRISDGRWESAAAWSSPGWGGYGNSSMISLVTADLPNDPSRGVYGGTGTVVQFGPSGWSTGISGMQINLNYTDQTAGTVSFWYRTLNTGSGNMWSGFYQVPGLDSRDANISVGSTADWAFYTRTRTWTNSAAHAYRFVTDSNSHDGTDFTWQLWGIQFEEKSHVTKWVNGSRSATAGWKDLSGNGNHADLTSLTYSTTNIVNTPNNDFSFDGANDYVSLGTPSSVDLPIGNNSRTVGVWFKANSGGSGQDGLIGWGSSGGTGYAWGLLINSNDTICIACYGDDVCAGSVRDDTWHYCVATHDSSTGNRVLYLDGVSIATDSSTLNTADASARVGDWIGSHKFHGTIDVVEVYNTALTLKEVLQNFNAKRSRFGV